MKAIFLALAPFVVASTLYSQDMVAVGWSGEVFTLDSRSASIKKIGGGLLGQNAAAVDPSGFEY